MKRLALLVFLLVAPACDRGDRAAPQAEPAEHAIATVTVDELAGLLAEGRAEPVDANGVPTRERQGVIPGATLLTSYRTYALSELPAEKTTKLVFYCANEQCGASHAAAERAIEAGYRDVAVLPAGIAGWRNAGQATETPAGT